MPYKKRTGRMSDVEAASDVSVVDVYDIASDIGKECEIIIDKYGADAVTSLLPKVINALELLENLAVKTERENHTVQELTSKISQLENDKIEKAEYRQRFEKDLETIEEQWRAESAELVSAVSHLQEQNRRLMRMYTSDGEAELTSTPSPVNEEDAEVLLRLTASAEKQRHMLRERDHILQDKQIAIDGLTSQVEKLTNVCRENRKKHKQFQTQIRSICEERADLSAIVQTQQKEIATLQHVIEGKNQTCARCTCILDDESDRPLFSTKELRAILHERNELKQRLQDVEEQLAALRPQVESPDSSYQSSEPISGETQDPTPTVDDPINDWDAPVQGPLPAEPDDAPWKKRQSGIRKFFRKLFSEPDAFVVPVSFPRGSLSTLASRMAGGGSPGGAGAPS